MFVYTQHPRPGSTVSVWRKVRVVGSDGDKRAKVREVLQTGLGPEQWVYWCYLVRKRGRPIDDLPWWMRRWGRRPGKPEMSRLTKYAYDFWVYDYCRSGRLWSSQGMDNAEAAMILKGLINYGRRGKFWQLRKCAGQ